MRATRRRLWSGGALLGGVILAATLIGMSAAANSNRPAVRSAKGKAAFEKAVKQNTAIGSASPAPTPSDPGVQGPPYTPDPPQQPEVYASPDYPGGGYVFTTGYAGSFGDVNVTVYAGALASEPGQGLLVVHDEGRTTYRIDVQSFPEPSTSQGALTIISADSNVLNIVAADGSTLYFDTETNTWVDQGASETPSSPAT